MPNCFWLRGDPVSRVGGTYRFDGHVVAVFKKRSGVVRVVVEDDRGFLHFCDPEDLRTRTENPNHQGADHP